MSPQPLMFYAYHQNGWIKNKHFETTLPLKIVDFVKNEIQVKLRDNKKVNKKDQSKFI